MKRTVVLLTGPDRRKQMGTKLETAITVWAIASWILAAVALCIR